MHRLWTVAVLAFAMSATFSTPAWATTPTVGTGTFTDSGFDTFFARQAGSSGVAFFETNFAGSFTGILTGSCSAFIEDTFEPNAPLIFSGSYTCTGSVDSHPGTFVLQFVGTQILSPTIQPYVGQLVLSGTGVLANVHGQGTFQGRACCGTYTVEVHFDP